MMNPQAPLPFNLPILFTPPLHILLPGQTWWLRQNPPSHQECVCVSERAKEPFSKTALPASPYPIHKQHDKTQTAHCYFPSYLLYLFFFFSRNVYVYIYTPTSPSSSSARAHAFLVWWFGFLPLPCPAWRFVFVVGGENEFIGCLVEG